MCCSYCGKPRHKWIECRNNRNKNDTKSVPAYDSTKDYTNVRRHNHLRIHYNPQQQINHNRVDNNSMALIENPMYKPSPSNTNSNQMPVTEI